MKKPVQIKHDEFGRFFADELRRYYVAERQEAIQSILAMDGKTIEEWTQVRSFLDRGPDDMAYDDYLPMHAGTFTSRYGVIPVGQTGGECPFLYCRVTGQPIGQMSMDMVTMYLRSGFTSRRELYDNALLMAGTAPHWTNKTTKQLALNRNIDPWGYCVYILDEVGTAEKRRYMGVNANKQVVWKDTKDFIKWQRSKIVLFKLLRHHCDLNLILRVNEMATVISAELGWKFVPFPITRPEIMGSDTALRTLIRFMKATWMQREEIRKKQFYTAHAVHAAVATYAVKDQPETTKKEFMRLALLDAQMETFGSATSAKAAYESVNIAKLDAHLDTVEDSNATVSTKHIELKFAHDSLRIKEERKAYLELKNEENKKKPGLSLTALFSKSK